jgi:4-hydroxybenzoyl-CoA thioesterase
VTYFTHVRPLLIEWGHCDPAGIVFNPRFFEYFDWGSWMMFNAALGMTSHEWLARYNLVGISLVEASANFASPLKFGDMAELTSTVRRFGRSSFDVEHRITIGDRLSVEGLETRVWAVRHPTDPARIKAAPIPPEVIEKFTVK